MEIFKHLNQAFVYGGMLFALSFLIFLRFEAFGVAGAVATFALVAIHDIGASYIETTKQSPLLKHSFAMIVRPAAVVTGVTTFIYIYGYGKVPLSLLAIAVFVAFIVFMFDAVALIMELKKQRRF